MRASLWPPTLAAIPLAFGIAWLAHWLLLLIGWRIRAADHIAYVVWSVAVPVIWIALVAGTAMLRARRIGAATTMGLMAGYGVQLWPILQDLHQLRDTYGTRTGTFLSNAGLVQVFNVNDTADWISRALGEATEAYETGSLGETRHRTWQSAGSTSRGTGTASHLVRRALLTPDEIRRLPPDSQILFKAGAPPIFARKLRYYADPEFRGLLRDGAKGIAFAGADAAHA